MGKSDFNQKVVWLLNEKYGGRLTEMAKKDITRLKKGEPVDYVIGYKNFCGCKIDLRYKPLIPRDETEHWMSEAIRDMFAKGWGIVFRDTLGCSSEQPRSCPRQNFAKANHAILPADAHKKQFPSPCFRVLDIFAGSGCCGIAVLKHIPNSHCSFVDIDDNCLKQIRLNLRINGIDKKRYSVIKSNVFKKIRGQYDLILANPPYIAWQGKNKVQESVLNFEPKQALFAKNNGLYFIGKFLKQAKNHSAENGIIYLEFGYNQKKEVEKILEKFSYKNFKFHKDQFDKWRFAIIKLNL
ncbi:MAG: peptide chain release factor N(5)-glutamine methyltransferase [Candidatus Pacebacteria bacterium]|nr:peptide chain release factor N(5)-glutamine methyltransferase [Candidatus Paceibacterota bacterium]